MRRFFVPLLSALVGLSFGYSSAMGGGIPAKTLREVKSASCYVKVQFGLPIPGGKTIPGTGSGFLIRTDGETGFVVTNHHVVSPPKEIPGLVRVGDVVLVFDSGNPGEKIIKAEVVASDPIRDLAILRIKGMKELPRPIVLDPKVELVETMTVYAFGFPFGGALATGKLNPAITVTKGTISSIRNDDSGKVRLVQIDAEINPGNSGGPVVDEKGNLVGVAVSKIDKSRIGFAVPTYPITEMMVGKVSSVAFDTAKVERSSAEVEVEAALIDPLSKLGEVAIHYERTKSLTDVPKADKEGKYPLLKGTKVNLEIDKGKAKGRFTFLGKFKIKGKESITYQAVYVNGEGKTVTSAPATAQVDFTQVIFNQKLTAEDPIDKLRKQPSKTFDFRMQRGKHYVVEMRGDPKDLDPWLRIEDARGANLAEDDDSGGVLNSLIVFTPTTDEVFKIVATVLRGTGEFSVRIREEEGETAKGFRKKTNLKADDPLDKLLQAPAQTFNLIMKRGVRYTIDMKSKDFDTFLRLENMAGVNLLADDDGGGELNSRIVFTPGQDSIFRVIATSFDKNTGEYELTIKEGGAIEVGAEGLRIAGVLNAGDPLDPVLGKAKNSRAKTFEVNLEAGQRYQLDLISKQFDPLLRIEDAKGKQLAIDDDSGGDLNARLVFTPPATGTYRIFATTYDGGLGQFGLVIRKAK